MRGCSGCRRPRTPAKKSRSFQKKLSPSKTGPAALAGALLGAATAAVYLIGANRSFGYDAAATFSNFVATPSIWDAFAVRSVLPTIPLKEVATNDHVLLSLASHLIYSATGTRSEVVYRLVPALAAGATVGLTTFVLSRRFGMLAAGCAGLYVASDPLFVENSRDLRGYSVAALGSLAASLILTGKWTRRRLAAYGLVVGLAIAAQLFAGVVLLIHIAYIAWRRPREQLVQLVPAWLLAGVIGAGANANIQIVELTQHGLPPSLFYPAFPRDVVFFLVGAPALLPLGIWLSTLGLGLWTLRSAVAVWATIAVTAALVLILWLWIRPAFLYPRFFMFLVPACAFVMAAAIARWWVLGPAVLVGVIAAVVSQIPGYTEDPLALPQAAAAVERFSQAGGRACVIHSDEQVLAAYTRDFEVVSRVAQLPQCDAVVVVSWNVDLSLRDLAAQQFPRLTTLGAYYPAVVLEK